MLYFFIALAIVVVDQGVKLWVLDTIPLYEHIDFIPHVMSLTYIQNTGAAFSFLSGQTHFLTVISVVMSLFLGYLLHIKYFSHPLGQLSLGFVLGGAIGNLIDRAFRGFVVDMFHLLFVRFAIFNVADIFVVVGGIGCAVYYVCFYDKFDAPPEEETPPQILEETGETE